MTGEFAIAVHSLVYLSHAGMILSSEMLAENVCTNPVSIRKVMAKLKSAGLVSTKEGLEGGYLFQGDALATDLRSICDALGMSVVPCARKPGNVEMKCLVASGMGKVMEDIYVDLNALCRERLSQITIGEIEERIFQSGKSFYSTSVPASDCAEASVSASSL